MKLLRVMTKYRELHINPNRISLVSSESRLNPHTVEPYILVDGQEFGMTQGQYIDLLKALENATND